MDLIYIYPDGAREMTQEELDALSRLPQVEVQPTEEIIARLEREIELLKGAR